EKDDGIFISQDKYVANILKKFDFATVKTLNTPIETNKALLKDEEAKDVDVNEARGADEELSDRGSLLVIVYRYDGLPMQPVAPPSSDYAPGPEHLPSPDYVHGPEHLPSPVEVPYVPEPEYPEYLVPADAEAPLEDQPLPADASPTALSPGYVADFNLDEDLEEDPEEDHVDYLADRGDDDDEPSDDDDDDDDTDDEDEEPFEDEDDDEEEEEHLALADSSAVPVIDHTCLRKAQKTVRLEPPMSPSMEARIAEYAAAPTPPSPL
ncbi:hypothetical protein Tco_1260186, partial [Tanacetum coccineum]